MTEWTPRAPRLAPFPDFPALEVPSDEENLPAFIHGWPAESTEEARVAVALDTLNLGYDYQVQALRPEGMPGSTRIDFVVHTIPLATPLYVQSSYWHGQATADQEDLRMAQIRRVHRWEWTDPQEVWDYEIPTIEAAVRVLGMRLGRG